MARVIPRRHAGADHGRTRFLVRSIDHVKEGDGFVDLSVVAVAYREIGVAPGIVTAESPSTQGLRRNTPHAPDFGDVAAERRNATIRLRMAAPDVVRLTVVPDRPFDPRDDGTADGILVDPQPGDSELTLVETTDQNGEVRMSTGTLSFVVNRSPFSFRLCDIAGAVLLASGGDLRQAMGAPLAAALAFDDHSVSVSFELRPDDDIVGLGEQAGPPVRNGQRLEIAVNDPLGTGTGRTYKAAPIFHSRRGYTVFVHTPGTVTADIGARYPSILNLDADDSRLDLFLIVGGGLKHRLGRYTALTGRMSVPPTWAFGVWMSRSRYRDQDEAVAAARGMRAHDIPCDVIHVDPSWLERDVLNCDFVWSSEHFPDPDRLLDDLFHLGMRLSLWELPYVDPESPVAQHALEAGFLVGTDPGTSGIGTPATVARTFSRDGRTRWLVDFSNPEARTWWQDFHAPLLDRGIAVFKTDFGEGLPDDAQMSDGRTGRRWKNLYPLWYNRCVFEVTARRTGRTGLVWGRSGWAGSQRYPAQWSGDAESSVAGMAATIRAGLAWSLSAPGLWSHDVGGFYGGVDGSPSPELYIRWAQFGCLSPLTRFHGLTPREPWEFGPRALQIVRDFVRLRYRLLPYLLSAAWECARTGVPIMRAMCIEFEGDPRAWHVPHQYLLGGDLLVAPVLDESPGEHTVDVEVPPGEWVDFFTGARYTGPSSVGVTVGLATLPLLVRAGAVIPMGPVARCTDDIGDGEWTLHYYTGPLRSSTVHIPEGTCRYRPVLSPGRGDVVAITAEEPVPRATRAVGHEPGGGTRPLDIIPRPVGVA